MNMSIMPTNQPEEEIIITYEGKKVTIETVGFQGADCVAKTAFLLEGRKMIGNKKTLKAEYHKGGRKERTERIKL